MIPDKPIGADNPRQELFFVVATPTLKVRIAPQFYTAVVGQLRQGARVKAGETQGEWIHIDETIDGQTLIGWIHRSYLIEAPRVSAE